MELLKSQSGRVLIESHRGVQRALPENTWPAIKAAQVEGTDLIEVDVQLSADDVAFLHHNYTLEDGARCPSVGWQELQTQRVGGEKLPLLRDVLAWAREEDVHLSLDLKTGFQEFGRLVNSVTALIDDHKYWESVMLIAWDHEELLELKKTIPQAITRILLHARPVDIVALARAAQCNAVGLAYGAARPDDIENLHSNGIAVALAEMWTFDVEMVEELDVDIVCWGQPLEARKALGLE